MENHLVMVLVEPLKENQQLKVCQEQKLHQSLLDCKHMHINIAKLIYLLSSYFFYLKTIETRYAIILNILYHVFIPKNVEIICFKRIGEDEKISGQHNFFEFKQPSIIPSIQDYVAVKSNDH